MSLKKFVKISGVSNLSDARYCSGMMVNILGFNTDPTSEDYVSPETFRDITGWVSGIQTCGEFGNQGLEEIKAGVQNYDFDLVETARIDLLPELESINKPLVLNISSDFQKTIERTQSAGKYCILRIENINEVASVYSELSDFSNLILDTEFTVDKVQSIGTDWFGIQLKGTPEEQPGFKDYGLIMDVLELLEED